MTPILSIRQTEPVSRWYLIVWYMSAGIFLLFLPSFQSRTPFWEFRAEMIDPLVALFVGFAVSAAFILIQVAGRSVSIPSLAGGIAAVFLVVLAYILYTGLILSKVMILVHLPTAVVLLLFPLLFFRLRALCLVALMVLSAVVSLRGSGASLQNDQVRFPITRDARITSNYPVEYSFYADIAPSSRVTGGGIERVGNGFLIATGDGVLSLVTPVASSTAALSVKVLNNRVPINQSVFEEQTDISRERGNFRVFDLLVEERGDQLHLFASYAYWLQQANCAVTRVSRAVIPSIRLTGIEEEIEWQTVYDSQPCKSIDSDVRQYGAHQGGGRIARLDKQTLLLTLGDFETSGMYERQRVQGITPVSQDSSADYGKVLRINIADGTSEIFSMGHRNAQGLYVLEDRRVFETEHGPEGGDELNLLVEGRNYGWPFATYGTDYGRSTWKLSRTPGTHAGYEKPVWSWVGSIGISNLIQVKSTQFGLWRDDLMIASLARKSLHRVRLEGDEAVFAEEIYVGRRIRDLVEGADGRLALWTDEGELVIVDADADLSVGELAFISNCALCHETDDGAVHSTGPDLYDVIGRQIGSRAGYQYSEAMQGTEGQWTGSLLDRFIRDPSDLIPGTTMIGPGVESEKERSDIINYLSSLQRN